MKKNLLSFTILFLAIAIIVLNIWNNSKASKLEAKEETVQDEIQGVDLTEVLKGNPAPDFELFTLEEEPIKLSDYRGKKVILNFWATWCPPCKAEMPHMQNFYENNKDNGIEIIAVNATSAEKSGKSKIEDFITEYGLTFPVPLDEDGTIGRKYQALSFPTSYIINSKGIITEKIVGPMDENMMVTLTKDID